MTTFAQAYHYITNCPYRGLTSDPITASPLAEWFGKYALDIISGAFFSKDFVTLNQEFANRIKEIEKSETIYDKRLKLKMFQTAAIHTLLFIAEKDQTESDFIGEFKHDAMQADVHLTRLKPNNTCELIWFNFEPVLPDLQKQNILSYYVQWNGRAYELAYKRRPYNLTVYYPLIGDSINYTYNYRNRLDVVADLIDMGVLYTKPDKSYCPACRACPEFIRMI
ncbi:hypothetical protein [Acinetobacter sp.]|uniref:hypothetical protein n=1 Tax=Acinetobacter sp. TaxID=472 RepID=UPI003CFF2146